MVEKTALSGFYNKSEIDFIKSILFQNQGKAEIMRLHMEFSWLHTWT